MRAQRKKYLPFILAGLIATLLLSGYEAASSGGDSGGDPAVLLSGLTLSDGTLTPAFSAGVTSYTASVAYSVSSIVVTPTVADADLAVTVDGTKISSGAGATTTITVAAKFGTVTKTYTVAVTRGGPELSGLAPSVGTLSPTFGAGVTSYSISVANTENNIAFTPTAAASGLTIKINLVVVPSGTESAPINLAEGTTSIPITVSDGTATTTYTVTVTRAASALPTLSSVSIVDDLESPVSLNPSFTSGNTSYDALVSVDVGSVTFTVAVPNTSYEVKINGTTVPVTSGSGTSDPIDLISGANPISVTVTYGGETNTYTFTITKP